MKTILLPVGALKHYDFKDRLHELPQLAMGEVATLSIEEKNSAQDNAVVVYLGNKMLGYVNRGSRSLALAAVQTCEEGVAIGTVVKVGPYTVWVELETNDDIEPAPLPPNVLTDWTYDGPELPRLNSVNSRLKVQMQLLKRLLKTSPDHWTQLMEQALQYMEEHSWVNISGDAIADRSKLLEMLTALSLKEEAFADAAQRMEAIIGRMGGDTVRQKQVDWMLQMVSSAEVGKWIKSKGKKARAAVDQLPESLCNELQNGPKSFLTRIFYFENVSDQKARDVVTLGILRLRLEQEELSAQPKKGCAKVPANLINWAKGDQQRVNFVRDFAVDCILQEQDPELREQLNEMQESCRNRPDIVNNYMAPVINNGCTTSGEVRNEGVKEINR